MPEGDNMVAPVSTAALQSASADLLSASGLADEPAGQVAQALIEADISGRRSHGVAMLPLYVRRIKAGSVSVATTGTVVQSRGATAVIDGHHALGTLIGDQAMRLAVSKAREHGVGLVGVRHAFHFGVAGRYARTASGYGCIGLAMTNTRPLISAPGGSARLVGTNPIAIAIPTAGEIPVLLDLSFSAAAMGKVRLAAQTGEEIPDTWARDRHGHATTNPIEAIEGSLSPAAGHKGFGLAFMIDLICGLVSGGAMGDQVGALFGDIATPYDCSQVFMAIDLSFFGDEDELGDRAEREAERIRNAPSSSGVPKVTTPGQRSWMLRTSQQTTVSVPTTVLLALAEVAEDERVRRVFQVLAATPIDEEEP